MEKEVVVSFAQEKEDVILYHVLHDIKSENIFWIDVGANDPINISVTELFYLKGGRGINIEPQINYKQRYDNLRTRDINLFIGVSDFSGEMMLYGNGTGATMSDSKFIKNIGGGYKIPVLTLSDIWIDNMHNIKEVHFLKIDVEGHEKQCLNGLDFKKFRPWIVCIESVAPSTTEPCYNEWENILIENSYKFAYTDSLKLNRYYVANERNLLIQRFKECDYLENIYEIINASTEWKQAYIECKQAYTDISKSKVYKLIKPFIKIENKFKGAYK